MHKKFSRIIALMLAFVIVFALNGCGNQSSSQPANTSEPAGTSEVDNHNQAGKDVDNDVLNQIAEAHGKTVYQIILRWHMQEGLCPVPGSTNPDHILENISIFDFELTEEEMEAIRAVDMGEAGRSFNIPYGDWGFGNFADYTYDHSFTPVY